MTELNCTANDSLTFESSYLGLISYEKSVSLQNDLGKLAQSKNLVSIMGLQHPAVITLGRRARDSAELSDLFSKANHAIPVVQSTRGGLATIHSDGQLIIYPILNLRMINLGIQNYVSCLLVTTQSLLQSYGIASEIDIDKAGLYTVAGKISFCGIEVRNGITYHGLSLNVRNDLNLFSLIRTCGVENLALDKLQNYQVTDTLGDIFERWILIFKKSLVGNLN